MSNSRVQQPDRHRQALIDGAVEVDPELLKVDVRRPGGSTAGLMVSLIFRMPGGGHGINVFTPVLRPAAPPPGMYCVPRSSSMSILHSYVVQRSAWSLRSISGYSGRTAYSTLSPTEPTRTPTTRTTRPDATPSSSWPILASIRCDMFCAGTRHARSRWTARAIPRSSSEYALHPGAPSSRLGQRAFEVRR